MKKIAILICGLAMTAASMFAQTKVIAHRGHWNCEGGAQNSIAALRNAHAAGVYGSEFDVHITADGVVVVNHDDEIQGVRIETASYADLKDTKLANGEVLPTLRQYLEAGKQLEGMQLILEIKKHATPEREDCCIAECLKEVKELGLENRVDYISFSMHACEQLVKECPDARVYYLGSDVAPEIIKQKHLTGIDYHGNALVQNPSWIEQSHALGLKVNVWTIDDVKQMQQFTSAGVDFITTNRPEEALQIVAGNR